MLKPLIAAAGVAAAFGIIPVVTSAPAQACNPVPIPALGINADCGTAAALCLDARATGVGTCAAGIPAGVPPMPAPQAPIPGAGPLPGLPQLPPQLPQMPPPPAPPLGGIAQPQDPGQCGDLAYFTQHQMHCAQIAPTPPGFVPGQAG
jgi:hypothetical protein